MKYLFSVLAFVLLSITAFAQTGILSGKVTDEKQQSMIGAVVQIEQGNLTRGSNITDMYGFCDIKSLSPGTYTIRVNAAGYKTRIKDSIVIVNDYIYRFTCNLLPEKEPAGIADNTNRYNTHNLYYQALVTYAQEKYRPGDTLHIQGNYTFTDSLLPGNDQFRFAVLDYTGIRSYAEKTKRFTLLGVFPVAFENGIFSVHIVPYGVSYRKKKPRLEYVSSDSYEVIFHYKDGCFVFDRFEVHGM